MKQPTRATIWSLTSGSLLAFAVLFWRAQDRPSGSPVPGEAQTQSALREPRPPPPRAPVELVVNASYSASDKGKSWSERWAQVDRAASSSQRSQQRAMLLKELAGSDPQQAISLARLEGDPEAQQDLFRALLEGWAAWEIEKAGEWAMNQTDLHHDLAMSAVFNGAGTHPDAALELAQRLSQLHPERAQDYGSYLVFSLGRAGAHEKAADFATEDDSPAAQDWIISAYGTWARHQPEVAVLAATDLGNPEKRSTAFRAAIYAWAQTDPKALVDYANGFPAGEERSFALVAALRAWKQREPQAAKAWIAKAGPIPGIATVDED